MYTILVDIDGVQGNLIARLIPRLRHKYGVKLTPQDFTCYNTVFPQFETRTEIELAMTDERFVMSIPVIPGASRNLHRLMQDYRVVVATSRAQAPDAWTKEWLYQNNLPYHEYCNTYGRARKCELEGDELVDDADFEAFAFAGSGRPCLLYSQPWNAYCGETHFIQRSLSWNEVYTFTRRRLRL